MQPSPRFPFRLLPALIGAVLSLPLGAQTAVPASAPDPDPSEVDVSDLTDLSLEELMGVEVTVATRTPVPISDVPAAAYVIPGDEIRRAGHTSIQEALRMVPGFFVSHWNNSLWDVTARGFGTGLSLTSEAYLNQLLIMIDGVVVYTPLFAGTWWALQEIDLADVDRIEIIRGPGGIAWGANTVHGVVNVITKSASDTQGLRIDGRVQRDQWNSSARYGGPLGESGHFRSWAKTTSYGNPRRPWAGYRADWEMRTGGFRADWETDGGRQVAFWGRGYEGNFRGIGYTLDTFEPFSSVQRKNGGQIAFSVSNPETGSRWHAYYNRDQQNMPTLLDMDIDVFDLEFQDDTRISDRQMLTWGIGTQVIHSDLVGDDYFWLAFDPISQVQVNSRAFLVDTIEFPARHLQLQLGAQALDTKFAGFDLQPSARLKWQPNERFMSWFGISRAVRTPSLEEESLTWTSYTAGNKGFDSEELLSYEAGFRKTLSDRVAVDVATYYNEYDSLHVFTADPTAWWGGRVMNTGRGKAYGAEVAVDAKPTERWSLRGAVTYSHGDFEFEPTGQNLSTDKYSPKAIYNLRSYYDLNEHWELDAGIYGVQNLSPRFSDGEYWRTDVRVGWNPNEHFQFSLGVQGLTDPWREEYHDHTWPPPPDNVHYDLIGRTVFVAMTYSR